MNEEGNEKIKFYKRPEILLIEMAGLSIVIGYKIGYSAGRNHEHKELNKLFQRF